MCYNVTEKLSGAVAQMEEHHVRNVGVVGSSPICSTIVPNTGLSYTSGFKGFVRSRVRIVIFSAFSLLCYASVFVVGEADAKDKYSDLSGTWYKSSPEALHNQLSAYLKKAAIPRMPGEIISVISPHAGYSYSGPVAAYSFKALQAQNPKTIVIVGFTHNSRFPGLISVFTGGAFVTPLGRAVIDAEVSDRLLSFSQAIQSVPEAFDNENSVEMLLPLAQTALPDARFVLVAISDQQQATADIFAEALYEILRREKDIVAVASTDMSHFLAQKHAVKKDTSTINKIKEMDPESFYRYSLDNSHELMCGQGAVYAVMKASIKVGADSFKVLKYATSGDISGDASHVVGYLSAVFLTTKPRSFPEISHKEENEMFSSEEKRNLLKIARNTIEKYLTDGNMPDVEELSDGLNAELGGFVTLHQDGSLRGCIGRMEGEGPFYRTVMEMAVAAAVNDFRFRPVRLGDLDSIDIEISALSPMRKISETSEIEMGKHGVMVTMGKRSGVYLPQVAVETGWTREEFMNSLCEHKAGIPRSAWKTGEADIYVYTAEVFGEKNFNSSE